MHIRPASLSTDRVFSVPSPAGRADGRLPGPWLLLLVAGLGASALLPQGQAWLVALAAIILLGVPHGALDGEVARPMLRPRFGRAWFAVFSVPYLTLSALVLLCWHVAPLFTLAAFLAASVWHFGEEDAGPASVPAMLARGGLPIAVPVLLHPASTAAVFAAVTGTAMTTLPVWLTAFAWAWLVLAPVAVVLAVDRRGRIEMAGLVALFAVLPPLSAFAIYFVGFHAPRHMAGLVGDPARAPRVATTRSAVLRSLPVTGLTLVLGALLWRFYPGPAPSRLLALTLQGLAALTLPHLLLSNFRPR